MTPFPIIFSIEKYPLSYPSVGRDRRTVTASKNGHAVGPWGTEHSPDKEKKCFLGFLIKKYGDPENSLTLSTSCHVGLCSIQQFSLISPVRTHCTLLISRSILSLIESLSLLGTQRETHFPLEVLGDRLTWKHILWLKLRF